MGESVHENVSFLEKAINQASLPARLNGKAGYHLGLIEDKWKKLQSGLEIAVMGWVIESQALEDARDILKALRRWHLSTPCEECGEDAIELRDPYHDTIEAVLCINPTCLHTEGLSNLLPDDE